jgi:hypothetical protein
MRLAGVRLWSPEEDEELRKAVAKYGGRRHWKAVAEEVKTRNHTQCQQRWSKSLRPGLAKGLWTSEEDELLVRLVAEYGHDWPKVAEHWDTSSFIQSTAANEAGKAKLRTVKQIRERWANFMSPTISREPWSLAEDQCLLELHKTCGNSWSTIAKKLPGRAPEGVKTRFKSLARRQQKLVREKQKQERKAELAKAVPTQSAAIGSTAFDCRMAKRARTDQQHSFDGSDGSNGSNKLSPPSFPRLAHPDLMHVDKLGTKDAAMRATLLVSRGNLPQQNQERTSQDREWSNGTTGAVASSGMERLHDLVKVAVWAEEGANRTSQPPAAAPAQVSVLSVAALSAAAREAAAAAVREATLRRELETQQRRMQQLEAMLQEQTQKFAGVKEARPATAAATVATVAAYAAYPVQSTGFLAYNQCGVDTLAYDRASPRAYVLAEGIAGKLKQGLTWEMAGKLEQGITEGMASKLSQLDQSIAGDMPSKGK